MTDTAITLSTAMQAATHNLGQSLADSEPFTRYVNAQSNLENDQTASDLLDILISTQNSFQRQQRQGGVTQADIDQIKAVQGQVQKNPTIMEYANSQKEAIAFLKEINKEISQQLGMDFALIAKRSCG